MFPFPLIWPPLDVRKLPINILWGQMLLPLRIANGDMVHVFVFADAVAYPMSTTSQCRFLHGWSLTCCVRYIWTKENNGPTCISEMTKPPAMNIDDVCLIPKRLRYGRKLKMIKPKALLRLLPTAPCQASTTSQDRCLRAGTCTVKAASQRATHSVAERQHAGGEAAWQQCHLPYGCVWQWEILPQNCLLMGTYSKTSSSLVYPILPYFQTNPYIYIYIYIYIWYYRIVVLSSRWPLYVQQKIQWKIL